MPEPLHGSALKAVRCWQLGAERAGAEQEGHPGSPGLPLGLNSVQNTTRLRKPV